MNGLLALLIVTVVPGERAPEPPFVLSPSQQAHLQAEVFAPVRRVRELPLPVREGLRSLFKERAFEMAEPGATFQETDVILTDGLPFRRLIIAGCSPHHCLVHYEQGGYSHTFHVVLFRLVDGLATFEWGGLSSRKAQSLAELKALVRSGAIDGSMAYW